MLLLLKYWTNISFKGIKRRSLNRHKSSMKIIAIFLGCSFLSWINCCEICEVYCFPVVLFLVGKTAMWKISTFKEALLCGPPGKG